MDANKAKIALPNDSLPWSRRQRLEFIDFRLQWEGHLNRRDLMEHFGISIPQASNDIATYTELAPSNLKYDHRQKVYRADNAFKPVFASTNSQQLLTEMLGIAAGTTHGARSNLSYVPDVAQVPFPNRLVSTNVLTHLLKAVRKLTSVQVLYQSMTRENPSWRTLSPHAFAHDGSRWHVRAYCHKREDFLDFVLSRIFEAKCADGNPKKSTEDTAWHTWVTIVLGPHPSLSAAQKKAIELDYGMENGEMRLPCRQSLLFYAFRRFGLNISDAPAEQQVVLLNRDELMSLIKPI
jgi:predicted DNA-binding transcriptional regulator YafY